jgi:hypothetical protein
MRCGGASSNAGDQVLWTGDIWRIQSVKGVFSILSILFWGLRWRMVKGTLFLGDCGFLMVL